MRRRELLQALSSLLVAPRALRDSARDAARSQAPAFRSRWSDWPAIRWLGPEVWANRLQDWAIEDGAAVCKTAGRNRAAYCLTQRVDSATTRLTADVTVLVNTALPAVNATTFGFRVGAKGRREHYLSAVVYGTGLDVGLTADGRLRIGDRVGESRVTMTGPVRLRLECEMTGTKAQLQLTATDAAGATTTTAAVRPAVDVHGPLGLLSHVDAADSLGTVARFSDWTIDGAGLVNDPAAAFGPVAFAHYTVHRGTLKLTAQLTPIESIAGLRVALEFDEGGEWVAAQTQHVDPAARTAEFGVPWSHTRPVPYRVAVTLPLGGTPSTFHYPGVIAKEPVGDEPVVAACFSCNCDHGFPDEDVAPDVRRRRPHLALFVGDQFYESHGGFGIQTAPADIAALDYLRKWYMFGLSYREVFRDIPAVFIPDDHDVYHGNIWGEDGVAAPVARGWGAPSQDMGGYKMPPAWVNMVQRTQTSHLPDPYDGTPVRQGIGVYYTAWDYGGLSLALLEDRKFKSAPSRVMPSSAAVVNGFATAPGANLQVPLPDDAALLGDRQEQFLEAWSADWAPGVQFKVVVSQTSFAAAHTLPAGSTSGEAIPNLPLPAPGDYVSGDEPAGDMDTNGWPRARRDMAVRAIRKGFAVHVAGDQHLASVMRYGVDRHRDAGFAFTVPALNNIWPRRWWPTPPAGHQPLPGRPAYTGDFDDAFGNKLTMYAAANPRRSGETPAIIHDRATGFGFMVFDKVTRTIRLECWPRAIGRAATPTTQYEGWPMTVAQLDNYAMSSSDHLPEIEISGIVDPVIQLLDNEGEVVYSLRVRGTRVRPPVPYAGSFTVRVGDGLRWRSTLVGVTTEPVAAPQRTLRVDAR